MSTELDQLFDGTLDNKMDFLDEKKKSNNDGIYRVDLNKAKDKKKGWKSVVRFLPNLKEDGTVGQSAIEKIAHYVKIQNPRELSGWFDSPKNFGEKCPLTDLYYTMKNSNNAILVEKADLLNYSRKYYSYVLVLEDEQQPELVGKIMVLQYGKTIKDKISAEKNGEISGEPCNVFDLKQGKDFVLVVKEIQTGDVTYPDYKMSMFRPQTSSLPVYNEEKEEFRNIPLDEDGNILDKHKSKVKEVLLDRDFTLEDFAPKRLTEEDQEKITEISNFLTGKTSNSFNKKNESATSDDFNLEDDLSDESTEKEEDDFFADL